MARSRKICTGHSGQRLSGKGTIPALLTKDGRRCHGDQAESSGQGSFIQVLDLIDTGKDHVGDHDAENIPEKLKSVLDKGKEQDGMAHQRLPVTA